MQNKKRMIIYIVCAVLIVGLSVLLIIQTNKVSALERNENADQEHALTELISYMDNIETTLQKGILSNTPLMINHFAVEILRDTGNAKNSLADLNTSDLILANTYKFLSQTGDFTMSLASKTTLGKEITEDERNKLKDLLKYCTEICETLRNYTPGEENVLIDVEALNSSLSDAEQSLDDFPTLIYDGPFSDHILNTQSEFLQNENVITQDRAEEIASEITGIKSQYFKFGGIENGNIECYTFYTDTITVSITKKGGHLCYILSSQTVKEETLTPKQAIEIASLFLTECSYNNMTTTYYTCNDGVCTINFAYKQSDVTCYTDLIKISVALDTGDILSVDARGFLMNHKERTFEKATLTREQSAALLSKELTILSSKTALIPQKDGNEYLCYEFKCQSTDEKDVLVYMDCYLPYERDILILLYSDSGILTK